MKKIINKVSTFGVFVGIIAFFGLESTINGMDYQTTGWIIGLLLFSFLVHIATMERHEN